jgi:hypothetical protein
MRKFYWPNMNQSIQEFCTSCDICKRAKSVRHAPYGLLQPLQIPEGPWTSIAMDFVTDLPPSEGMTTILTIVDRFTKMVHFIPLPKLPDAEETASVFIREVVRLHGLPREIVSDRGTQFTSHLWRRLLNLLGIQPCLSSAYHPQSNGQAERANQVLQQYLRCYVAYQQDDWVSLLPLAEFTCNNASNVSTGFSPFYLTYGYHPRFELLTPEDSSVPAIEERLLQMQLTCDKLRTNLSKAQTDQELFANTHRKNPPPMEPGDLVWLDARNITTSRPSKKLDFRRLGPFEIVRSINDVAHELKLPPSMRIHPVFHVSLLEKAVTNQYSNRLHSEPPPIQVEDQDEFLVKEVLDSRVCRKTLQYLIDWEGYPPSERAWINADDVHAPELVQQFHERHPRKLSYQDLDEFWEGGDVRG